MSAQFLTQDLRDRLRGGCAGLPGPADFARGAPVQPESAGDNVHRGARGARGAAGELGHTIVAEESRHRCRCGKFGCLEAFAGGWAPARDARTAALAVTDVLDGCQAGDPVSTELVTRAGQLVGGQLATLVSGFNPSTVYLAGSLARAGDVFRGPVAEVVARRSLPLAVDRLVFADMSPDCSEGVIGAATLAMDELSHPDLLGRWLPQATHAGLMRAARDSPRALT
ncbi:ROK family protein [Streptomyces sp. NPDC001858]